MPNPLRQQPCTRVRRQFRVFLVAALGAAACAGAAARPAPPAERTTLHVGFTDSMFTDVNDNDARASIKALTATVSRERDIPADPEPQLFNGTDAVAAAVRAGQVDAVGLTTDELWTLGPEANFDRYLMAVKNDDPTEEYVLLVPRTGGPASLADLRGKRLAVFANSRMSLGLVWLEVLLARQGLPEVAEHFGRTLNLPKLSKVVLDVFFRQTDACLVTRRGFATMAELNPQVGNQLAVLATSPAVVPTLFAFRTGFSASLKEKILREFSAVNMTPAGQQALTIFQVGQVAERPVSALDSALALLEEYTRLRPAASAALVQRLRHRQPAGAASAHP